MAYNALIFNNNSAKDNQMGAKLTRALFGGCFAIMWFLAAAGITMLVIGWVGQGALILFFALCFAGICGGMIWVAIYNEFEWTDPVTDPIDQATNRAINHLTGKAK